jgi:hypothetical protein
MGFQVSPGVQVKEIDLTNVVPAISTSIGGFAGAFNWGPVNVIRTIGSEQELVSTFGIPDDNTAPYFLSAAAFLQYGRALKVVRAKTTNLNATTSGVGQLIMNRDDYEDATVTDSWVAKYPGILGNSLKISICPADSTIFTGWAYADNFDSVPGTSDYASAHSSSNDEMHIAIIDEDGSWTGIAGTVLETYPFVSQASDAKGSDGTSIYYKDVLNSNSKYVWFGDHDATLVNAGGLTSAVADFNTTVVAA